MVVCDTQRGVSLAQTIAAALRRRGLVATTDESSDAGGVVICIDAGEWDARPRRIELFSQLETRAESLDIIPVVISRNGHFPRHLPQFLWLRQAAVLNDPCDDAGLDKIAGAIHSLHGEKRSALPARTRLFISYHSADEHPVHRLAEELEENGILTWMDRRQLQPGERWQDRLFEALETCHSIAVCIGPRGTSDWQMRELKAAGRRIEPARCNVISILLPPCSAVPKRLHPGVVSDRVLVWKPGQPIDLRPEDILQGW